MRRFVRLFVRQETVIWLLLTLALSCLPWALRREAPDAAFTLLLPAMLIGASGAFLLYTPSLRKPFAAGSFAAAGGLVLFIRIGQMGGTLAETLLAMVRLAATLLLPSPQPAATLGAAAAWLEAQGRAWTEVAGFAQRAAAWLSGILRGQVIDDPSSRALMLGLGLWLLAFWAGRRLRLGDDPLGALLPTTAALALTLDLTVQDRWPLWLHMAVLLVLLGITHLWRLLGSWRSAHTDYSDSIPEESLLSGTVIIILVLSVSFAVSTFSLHDFLDRFRRQETSTAATVDSSGKHRAGAGTVRSGGAAGLQSAHLITAGPALSQDVVMYVHTGDLPPMPPTVPIDPARYYWRGQTYQTYNGHAWSNRNRTDVRLERGAPLIAISPAGYRKVHVVVDVPAGISGIAYWSGVLVSADMPLDVAWHLGTGSNPADAAINTPPNVDLIGAMTVDDGTPAPNGYSFDALIPEPTEEQLQAAPASYPAWVSSQYLQLPDSVPERVRALARDITAPGRTPYDRAVAIERYLRLIPYSLDVPGPPATRDATDYFLFDLKKGYCDYYATSMTIMARAAGLPARLVTGYASGSYDSYSAEYVVREADAHSWTEIYFPGIGWVEFEPTAGQPLPHRETVRAAPVPSETKPSAARPKWVILPSIDTSRLGIAWLLVPALGGLYGIWLLFDGIRLRWMNAEQAVSVIYRRLRRTTGRMVGAHSVGETAREYAARIAGRLSALGERRPLLRPLIQPAVVAVCDLTDLRMLSLFASTPLSREQGRRAVSVWSAVRWRLALIGLFAPAGRASHPGAPSGTRGNAGT